jgi:hypothetical protein
MRKILGVLTCSAGVASLLFAGEAHALGPIDLELAARGGAGSAPGGQSPNPLGFGLGARAGVSFMGLYGGLSFINYFGETQGPTDFSVSSHALLYGVEGGYGSKILGLLTLRAQVGVGNFGQTVETKTGIATDSRTFNSLYVEPGILVMLPLGPILIGGDANVLVLPSRAYPDGHTALDAAFTVHAQIGVKF